MFLKEVRKGQFTKPALALDTELGSSEIVSEWLWVDSFFDSSPDFLSLYHEKCLSIFASHSKAILEWENSRKSPWLSRKNWKECFKLGSSDFIHVTNISWSAQFLLWDKPAPCFDLEGKLVLLFPRDKEAESHPWVTLGSGKKFKALNGL